MMKKTTLFLTLLLVSVSTFADTLSGGVEITQLPGNRSYPAWHIKNQNNYSVHVLFLQAGGQRAEYYLARNGQAGDSYDTGNPESYSVYVCDAVRNIVIAGTTRQPDYSTPPAQVVCK
jgi:hypothetical protein